MRGIFEKYGLVPAREMQAAEQATTPGIRMIWGPPLGSTNMQTGQGGGPPRRMLRNWKSLLTFSESPIPSRAITLVADRICSLVPTISPRQEFANDGTDYTDEIDLVRRVLDDPNPEDEDWPTFIRQIIEDQLVFDFGAWEYVEKPEYYTDNDLLSLCPVPGWSIERNALWDGDPTKYRWVQRQIGNNNVVPLLDKQMECIIIRKRTSRSYGISPVEVSIGLMEAWLGLSSYQAQVASEAYPHFLISLGEASGANQDLVDRFRMYWNLEIAGQGRPGVFGGFQEPKIIETAASGDEGLYLKYQERLERILAFTFRLKAMDFNIERDVNRSTAATSAHQSLEEAVKPYAMALASRINKRLIRRIAAMTKNPRVAELEYGYDSIDPWDAKGEADILTSYMDRDLLTMNEGRSELGLDAMENEEYGNMTISEYRSQFGTAAVSKALPEPGGPPETPENPEAPEPKASRARVFMSSFSAAGKKKLVARRLSLASGKKGRKP